MSGGDSQQDPSYRMVGEDEVDEGSSQGPSQEDRNVYTSPLVGDITWMNVRDGQQDPSFRMVGTEEVGEGGSNGP